MPNYLIKTDRDRNLIIEADEVFVESDCYVFRTKRGGVSVKVGFVNKHAVLAVMEDGLDKADLYFSDHEYGEAFNREHPNDVCTDCRNEELLESEEFFDAVCDIVQRLNEGPDELEEDEATTPEIERWETKGAARWGFQTPKGFVDFYTKEDAEYGLESYLNGKTNWAYLDLTVYTKKEIQ